jgi:hypothetical protein
MATEDLNKINKQKDTTDSIVEDFFDNAEVFEKNNANAEDIQPLDDNVSEEDISSELLKGEKEKANISNKLDVNSNVLKSTAQNNPQNKFEETLDGLIADSNINSSENKINTYTPFLEEFNAMSVVNRGTTSDFIVDDMKKQLELEAEIEKKNRKKTFLIPKYELENFISDNPGLAIYSKKTNENSEENSQDEIQSIDSSSIIANDLDGLKDDELIEISVPIGKREEFNKRNKHKNITDENIDDLDNFSASNEANDNYDDEDFYISDEEIDKKREKEKLINTLQGIQDAIEQFNDENEYHNPDDLFKMFLQDNFQDYLISKKISGNHKVRFSDKVIAKKFVEESNQQIEVADLLHSSGSEVKKTSVLIHRDDDMEIESIEILCKCGERTVIKFAQVENMDEKNLNDSDAVYSQTNGTEIVVDTLDVTPINYLKEEIRNEEQIADELSDEDIEELENDDYDDD